MILFITTPYFRNKNSLVRILDDYINYYNNPIILDDTTNRMDFSCHPLIWYKTIYNWLGE